MHCKTEFNPKYDVKSFVRIMQIEADKFDTMRTNEKCFHCSKILKPFSESKISYIMS